MDFFKQGVRTLQDAIRNKAYSKVGDGIANLIFSLGKAKASIGLGGEMSIPGTPKVSSRILKDALSLTRGRLQKEKQPSGIKGDAHAIADAVEAVLAFGWVNEIISLEESVDQLSKRIIDLNPKKVAEERQAYSLGFSDILEKILKNA